MDNQTEEQRQDSLYDGKPWAELAKMAGFRPYDTEASARAAFRFCAELIIDLDDALKPFVETAIQHAAGAPEWNDSNTVSAQISIGSLRHAWDAHLRIEEVREEKE